MSGIVSSAGSKSGVIGTTELDYEVGEFTLALAVTGGTVAIDTNYDRGMYVKIGQLVHIQALLQLGSGSGAGQLRVTLPFVSGNFGDEAEIAGGGVATYSVDLETAGTVVWQIAASGATYMSILVSTVAQSWQNINFGAADAYLFSCHYMAGS